MADKYVLRVTAGASYAPSSHIVIPVNTATPTHIHSALLDADLWVRVQNYTGLPRGSPTTSPYFLARGGGGVDAQYSIAMRFTLKAPGDVAGDGVAAADLQFGNDFDRPIRDRLPPGFNTALRIVRWWIDPGLEGDAYADSPYLYGPALSSFNQLCLGPGVLDAAKGGLWVEEGAGDDVDGRAQRVAMAAPAEGTRRMKWALDRAHQTSWTWKYGRPYAVDFFNPYLDFSTFSLRLPGFHLPILPYWDGQGLRYVLRNRTTGQALLVVVFTLHLVEDVAEDGSLKLEAEGHAQDDLHHDEAQTTLRTRPVPASSEDEGVD